MKPFKWLLCRRAEKNSEVCQTSKMELLEKIVKIFKEIPRQFPQAIVFAKSQPVRDLISMQQDSIREKI